MRFRRLARPAAAGVLAVFGAAAWAHPAQAPAFVALKPLQSGQWQLREVGGGNRSVCLRDPATLFQLRSRGAQCSRFVIEDAQTSATVHYTCPGAGHGRTTIAVETPRLIRVESQGVDAGTPFNVELEGRRTGSCAPGS